MMMQVSMCVDLRMFDKKMISAHEMEESIYNLLIFVPCMIPCMTCAQDSDAFIVCKLHK